MFTGYYDKNSKPIDSADKLLNTQHNEVYEIFYFDKSQGNSSEPCWLVCGGILSGDGLEYYADRCVIVDGNN